MAYLVCKEEDTRVYLKAHHVFGRLSSSANTGINKPEVSKIHAVIEWTNYEWQLTDFSTNGTWINNVRVVKNTPSIVKAGDKICFAGKCSNPFTMQNDAPPCDLLIPCDDKLNCNPIELKSYNLLPSDEKPEIFLFSDDDFEGWLVESTVNEEFTTKTLLHNEVIKLRNSLWQLKINSKNVKTVKLNPSISSLTDLSFTFNTSADEEATQLVIEAEEQIIDLKVRSHHYLTLLLARKRVEDIKSGITETEQGWLYSDQLCKDLGMNACHMNIQVHRARKQFSECLDNNHLAQLFERQCGKIRLGSNRITINKSGQIECS